MGQHIDIIAIYGRHHSIDIIVRFRVRQLRVAVLVSVELLHVCRELYRFRISLIFHVLLLRRPSVCLRH